MSENTTTVPAATDRLALRELLDAGAEITVRFQGCPLQGGLVGVYADGDLDVHVHDEDGRYDGDFAVRPASVLSLDVD